MDPSVQSNIGTDDKHIHAEALLSNLKTKIQVIYSYDAQIELLVEDEAELDTEMITSTDFHHLADVAVARLSALIDNYKKLSVVTLVASTASTSSTPPTSKLRLPKLQLPTFTGSYTDWMSFIDLFRDSVDENTQLTNSEKLNYLKACVKGDAAKLISSITITDSNYTFAMDLLIERYETINEHLRALRELGQPVSHWDALLVFWFSEKMDQESRKQWQLAHPSTDIKTWDDLSKFLHTRSRALETGSLKVGPPKAPRRSPVKSGHKFTTCLPRVVKYVVIHTINILVQNSRRSRYPTDFILSEARTSVSTAYRVAIQLESASQSTLATSAS